jgi:hypothetical protein
MLTGIPAKQSINEIVFKTNRNYWPFQPAFDFIASKSRNCDNVDERLLYSFAVFLHPSKFLSSLFPEGIAYHARGTHQQVLWLVSRFLKVNQQYYRYEATDM